MTQKSNSTRQHARREPLAGLQSAEERRRVNEETMSNLGFTSLLKKVQNDFLYVVPENSKLVIENRHWRTVK